MTNGEAICQEFSDEVVVGEVRRRWRTARDKLEGNTGSAILLRWIEEIQCKLNVEHFTGLVERMVEARYCCTQVQKDLAGNKCTAWFEPMSN
jgi:hypothetical protein